MVYSVHHFDIHTTSSQIQYSYIEYGVFTFMLRIIMAKSNIKKYLDTNSKRSTQFRNPRTVVMQPSGSEVVT